MDIPNIVHSMKEWQYNFSPVSREEWIKQIEADLRQKPVESLQSEWWPGEPLIPLVHAEDTPGEIVRLPDSLFINPPRITEWINTPFSSNQQINKRILDALHYGSQSIILQVHSLVEIFAAEWIREVHTEMITLQIQPNYFEPDNLPHLLKKIPAFALIRSVRGKTSEPLSTLISWVLNNDTEAIKPVRFVYEFPVEGNWALETAETFKLILQDLSQWKSAGLNAAVFFEKCILRVEADQEYFKQIIQTRTIHLLWQNIIQVNEIGTLVEDVQYMEFHIEQKEGETSDHFLIRSSTSALAASLAGPHSLCIHQAETEGTPEFYRRINRNIHHLLELESSMYKSTDPLAGAYALDFHTKRWVKEIWDILSL